MKHTGHVGLDGAYFGDISFLGGTKVYIVNSKSLIPCSIFVMDDSTLTVDLGVGNFVV